MSNDINIRLSVHGQQYRERIDSLLSRIDGLECTLNEVEVLNGYIQNQSVFEQQTHEKVEALLSKIDFLEKNLNKLESLDNYMESVDSYIRKQYFFEQRIQGEINTFRNNLKKVECLESYIHNLPIFEQQTQEKIGNILSKIEGLESNLKKVELLDDYVSNQTIFEQQTQEEIKKILSTIEGVESNLKKVESLDGYIKNQTVFEQRTGESIENILSKVNVLESGLKRIESLDSYIKNQTVFEQQTQGKIIALSDRIELLECRLEGYGFVGKNNRIEGKETEKIEERESIKKHDLSNQEVEQGESVKRRKIKEIDVVNTNHVNKTGKKWEVETVDDTVLDNRNEKFYRAWDLIENTQKSVFLTGKAGTGKTTFLKYLRNNTKKQHIILSPTGVAAVNAGGVTIHSFFQLELQPYLPKDDNLMKVKLKYKKEKIEIIRALELIIIDEISMVRSDVLEAVSYILQTYRGNNRPFGGVQMVFIGDLFQLPPVAEDDIWKNLKDYYRSEYFFDAPVLQSKSMSYFMIELDKIYRQTDNQFIDLLNKVRVNKLNECDYDALNQRYVESIDNLDAKGHIVLVSHRADANKVNRDKLNSLGNKLHKFKAIVEGDKEFKKAPADKLLELKVGAQVMLLRNNLPEYYNGSMGIVEEIGFNVVGFPPSKHDFVKIRLFANNQVVTVSQETWRQYEYHFDENEKKIVSKVVGEFTQFPVRLAWAMTIHKSQGLTFDKVIVDAEQAFAHGQTYVALSRCRSLEGLILKSPIPPESIIVDKRVVEFLENFKQSRIN